MKAYKFLLSLIAIVGLSLTSCSNVEEDVFEQSASERLQQTLTETQKILMSAENGWLMDYFPDRNKSLGGFQYIVKFDSQEVEVWSDLAKDPSESITSLYSMKKDDSAVLSFDTYNNYFHFFSTPNSTNYEAYDGDFEFKIMSATPEEVILKGKRNGNIIKMRPFTGDAGEYIAQCQEMSSSIFATAWTGTIGGSEVEGMIDLNTASLYLTNGSEEVGSFYLATPTGIRFVEPLTINGVTINELTYSEIDVTLNAESVSLSGIVPADYMKFGEFEGAYTFYFNGGTTLDVTLTPGEDNTYIMEGVSPKFNPVLTYNKTVGCLELNSQIIGTNGSNYIFMCAWGLDPVAGSGSLTWDPYAGMALKKSLKEENTLVWGENGYTDFDPVTSFILWEISASGSSVGQFQNAEWIFNGTNNNRLYYLDKMVKK